MFDILFIAATISLFCRLSWAGLLPLARLVEGTLDEWIDGPDLDEAGEPLQLHKRQVRRFSYDKSLLTCLVDR